MLLRFRYPSILSNAQDHYLSKSSLPSVQGVVYLSPPCPQLAVLRPCTHLSESPNMFRTFWSNTASLVGMGLHPVNIFFGSRARDYVNRFNFRCRHYEFLVRVFLNMLNHVYAISKHCYIFNRLSMPCPVLLHLRMQKSFFLPHDFDIRMLKLSRKVFYSPVNCLQTVAFNCFCSSRQRRRDSPCPAGWRFRAGC